MPSISPGTQQCRQQRIELPHCFKVSCQRGHASALLSSRPWTNLLLVLVHILSPNLPRRTPIPLNLVILSIRSSTLDFRYPFMYLFSPSSLFPTCLLLKMPARMSWQNKTAFHLFIKFLTLQSSRHRSLSFH